MLGNLDATIYSNKLVHDYQYDALNRLIGLDHFRDANGDGKYQETDQRKAAFDYTVRADGKRTSATEKFYGPTGTVQTTNEFDWTYDSMGRLISEVLDSSDDNLDYVDAFAFDLNGNRLKQTRDWGSTSKVDYATTYAYDINGPTKGDAAHLAY